MRIRMVLTKTLPLAAVVCFAFPRRADAYMDVNVVTMALQFLVAGIIGAVLTIRIYWSKIKSFFSSKAKTPEDDTNG